MLQSVNTSLSYCLPERLQIAYHQNGGAHLLTEDSLPREIAGIDDPLTLSVIDQAAYVLQRFEEKMNAGRLVQLLKGETSLAQAYIIFFGQMGWIKEDSPGHWQLTGKGRQTMKFLLPKDKESRQKKGSAVRPDSII